MKSGVPSYKKIWQITYPIVLTLIAQNVINVTDTAFLGRVGEVELGASALAGIFYIAIFMLGYGFSTGTQIMKSHTPNPRNIISGKSGGNSAEHNNIKFS